MTLRETILQTRTVFDGNYLKAYVHTVRLPDGTEATRETVAPPDAVGIFPLDAEGKVHLVRQFRTAIGRETIEIPAGLIEPGEDPIKTAERECKEEIGLKPGRLVPLCSFYHSVGFSSGKIQIVVADKLEPVAGGNHPDAGEFLEVVVLAFDTLLSRIRQGEIVDSKTIVAALWYRWMQEAGAWTKR